MTTNINLALHELFTAYIRGNTLALFFDYDGTLVPIVQHPRLAVLAPETRRLLQLIAMQPRVHIAILSGRALDNLKAMVGISGLTYVGTSGLECEFFGRNFSSAGQENVELLERVSNELRAVSQSIAGAWVEQKPIGLTWHYRDVSRNEMAQGHDKALEKLTQFGDSLRVVNGPMALEITPNIGVTKGTAVDRVCEMLGRDVCPAYFGDHENDFEAFNAVLERGGVSVGVGPDCPPAAEHRLADPPMVGVLLRRLAHFLTNCE
jgi:trehalose 6-phosphate phosphatase